MQCLITTTTTARKKKPKQQQTINAMSNNYHHNKEKKNQNNTVDWHTLHKNKVPPRSLHRSLPLSIVSYQTDAPKGQKGGLCNLIL
jgi:hypothetical protein